MQKYLNKKSFEHQNIEALLSHCGLVAMEKLRPGNQKPIGERRWVPDELV
jgi:hypothetical protein